MLGGSATHIQNKQIKMKTTSLVALLIASIQFTGCSQDSKTNQIPTASVSNNATPSEAAAWDSAVQKGTVDAYLAFSREHPKSERIKVQTGTVRGRYWNKVAMPFGGGAQKSESGVLVTVEGMKVLRNVSLEEAKTEKLLDVKPATKGENVSANGQTFNWTCMEVTDGGCVVNDELISPKDSIGAMVVLSGDGTSLLAWDVQNAKAAAQPDKTPTYIDSPANASWLPKP